MAVQFIIKLVDPAYQGTILVLGNKFKDQILEKVNPDNLEQKFGGNIPDKEANFWPPNFSPEIYKDW